MKRAMFVETHRSATTVKQLVVQLQASETDKFVAHLYQARKQ
jgi:hypothetical protein